MSTGGAPYSDGVGYYVEIETREIEYDLDEDGRAVRESRRIPFNSRQSLWLLSDRSIVQATTRANPDPDGESTGETGESELSESVTVFDLRSGRLWRQQGSGEFVAAAHEVEAWRELARRRTTRTEMVDLAVRTVDASRVARFLEPVEIGPPQRDFDGWHRTACTFQPGIAWEITSRPGELSENREMCAALCFSLLSILRGEARRLASRLPGVPVSARGEVLTDPGRRLQLVARCLRAPVPIGGGTPRPPAAALELSMERAPQVLDEALERLASGTAESAAVPSPEEALESVLSLPRELDSATLERLEDIADNYVDLDPRVELYRRVARTQSGVRKLEKKVREALGDTAFAALLALIVEHDVRASANIVAYLQRDDAASPFDRTDLVDWSVRQLRLLSGLSVEELVDRVGGFWVPLGVDQPLPSREEAMARELEYWFERVAGPPS